MIMMIVWFATVAVYTYVAGSILAASSEPQFQHMPPGEVFMVAMLWPLVVCVFAIMFLWTIIRGR